MNEERMEGTFTIGELTGKQEVVIQQSETEISVYYHPVDLYNSDGEKVNAWRGMKLTFQIQGNEPFLRAINQAGLVVHRPEGWLVFFQPQSDKPWFSVKF